MLPLYILFLQGLYFIVVLYTILTLKETLVNFLMFFFVMKKKNMELQYQS